MSPHGPRLTDDAVSSLAARPCAEPLTLAPRRSYVKCNRAVKATALCYAARQVAEHRRDCGAAGFFEGDELNSAHPRLVARGGLIVA